MKERSKDVEIPDPARCASCCSEPWPDFMTFYGTPATGAGWIVPKKYVEKVGEDGFKKAPIGAGPYKFVSFKPGVELVFEAFDGYWRKVPSVKRLVMRSLPEETHARRRLKTRRGRHRLPAGRADWRTTSSKTPAPRWPTRGARRPCWLEFPEQWDPIRRGMTARAARGQSGHRQHGDQRGGDARLRPSHRHHHPEHVRFCAGAWSLATTRRRPGTCWPRPAIPTASTRVTYAVPALRRMGEAIAGHSRRSASASSAHHGAGRFMAAWREKKLTGSSR